MPVSKDPSENIYVARQPIVTADNRTFGYELLFRSLQTDGSLQPKFEDGMVATARVIVNALNHVGLKNLVGDRLAFVNVDKELLLDDMIFSVPRERFILELVPDIHIDHEMLQRLERLKQRGYILALDNGDCSDAFWQKYEPVFSLMDILKLDANLIDPRVVTSRLEALKRYEFKLLAKKVETREQFDFYRSIGCQLFQGYFFAKPIIVKKKNVEPKYKNIFKLINMLDSDVSTEEITCGFEQQPEITIQLLRFMNSGLLGLSTNIRSISHAVTLLGKRPLKKWLLLIAFAKSEDPSRSLNSPIIELALKRSNIMSELIKKISDKSDAVHEAALVGILSLIDVITQTELKQVLEELRIDKELTQALLEHQGELGLLLELAIRVENFELERGNQILEQLNLAPENMQLALECLDQSAGN